MKVYQSTSKITFLEYKGLTVKQVFDIHPEVIYSYINDLDHFYVDEATIIALGGEFTTVNRQVLTIKLDHHLDEYKSSKYYGIQLKYYSAYSIFDFGKYRGRTLSDIAEEDLDYINWCFINMHKFMISDDTASKLGVTLGEVEQQIASLKIGESFVEDESYSGSYDDYCKESDSHGHYAGSYAQEVEGLSDNYIDAVLDGDTDMYWNID